MHLAPGDHQGILTLQANSRGTVLTSGSSTIPERLRLSNDLEDNIEVAKPCGWVLTVFGGAAGDIRQYSCALSDAVTKLLDQTGSTALNIVAHSMGGLVSRHYIEIRDGSPQVNKLIMIGTPNHGTPVALDWRAIFAGIGGDQMQPCSDFLYQLNTGPPESNPLKNWILERIEKKGDLDFAKCRSATPNNHYHTIAGDTSNCERLFHLTVRYVGGMPSDCFVPTPSVSMPGGSSSPPFPLNHIMLHQDPRVLLKS